MRSLRKQNLTQPRKRTTTKGSPQYASLFLRPAGGRARSGDVELGWVGAWYDGQPSCRPRISHQLWNLTVGQVNMPASIKQAGRGLAAWGMVT